MLTRLGQWVYRHRRIVVVGWLGLTVLGILLAGRVVERTVSADEARPDTESRLARDRVDQLTGAGPEVLAVAQGREVYDPVLVASVDRVHRQLRNLPEVVRVADPHHPPGGAPVGADDRSILIRVELARALGDPERADERERAEQRVAALLRGIEAPRVLVGGEALAEREFARQALRDAVVGESVALAVLVILLLVLLGWPAVLVPLVAVAATVATTLLGLLALSGLLPIGEFTVNVVTLLGTGLAVDYALLVVHRHRRGHRDGAGYRNGHEDHDGAGRCDGAGPGAPLSPDIALGRTVSDAGRVVVFAGIGVAVALAGLWLFGEPMLASMALGGALAALVATAAGLTVVPALAALTVPRRPPPSGPVRRQLSRVRPHRLRGWRLSPAWPHGLLHRLPPRTGRSKRGSFGRRPGRGLLARLARYAQRRPVPVTVAGTAGLLLLAAPFVLGAEPVNSDARALPPGMEARQLHDVLVRDFDAGRAGPVTVVVSGGPGTVEVRDLMNRLSALPQVLRMQPRPDIPGQATVIDLTPAGAVDGPAARELVRRVRALDVAYPLLVGGTAAELVDRRASVAARLPLVLLVLGLATGLLLLALTGAPVVAVKALLLSALSLGATLGVVVMVFQWGLGAGLIGVEPVGVDLTTPLLLLVFVVGLSTDYEVFLLAAVDRHRRRLSAAGTPSDAKRTGDEAVRVDGRGSPGRAGPAGAGIRSRVGAGSRVGSLIGAGIRSRADAAGRVSDRAVRLGITDSGPVVTAAACCLAAVFLGFLFGELTAVRQIGFGMLVALVLDVTVVRGLLLPALMSLLGRWNWWPGATGDRSVHTNPPDTGGAATGSPTRRNTQPGGCSADRSGG